MTNQGWSYLLIEHDGASRFSVEYLSIFNLVLKIVFRLIFECKNLKI